VSTPFFLSHFSQPWTTTPSPPPLPPLQTASARYFSLPFFRPFFFTPCSWIYPSFAQDLFLYTVFFSRLPSRVRFRRHHSSCAGGSPPPSSPLFAFPCAIPFRREMEGSRYAVTPASDHSLSGCVCPFLPLGALIRSCPFFGFLRLSFLVPLLFFFFLWLVLRRSGTTLVHLPFFRRPLAFLSV